MKKKVLCFIMASSLIIGAMPVQAARFTDMNEVPWSGAETYIEKVAGLGLMVGSDDLKGRKVFRPKNNITYAETAQLIYSLMKTTGKIDGKTTYATNWTTVMASYKVPTWAYESVGFCLTKGIINISDVAGFTNPNGKDKSATRENVAIMFGKALKEYVPEKGGKSYNDGGTIDSAALEYVNYLSGLGILSGDTDKNFNPKQPINRAEMAVLVTKAHSALGEKAPEKSGPKTAIITQIENFGGSMLLTVSIGGESRTFSVGSGTIVTKGTAALTYTDLGIYDTVEIDYDGGTVKSIKITDDFQVTEPGKNNNNDKNNNNSNNNSGGVKTDDTKVSKTYDGYISYLSSKKITIYPSSGSSKSFEIASNVDIEYDGKSIDYDRLYGYYKDVEKIDVTLGVNKDNIVVEIEAEESDTISGTVKDVTKSKIQIGSKKYTLAGKSDLTIKIDGKKNKTIDDLIEAYEEEDVLKAEIKLDRDEVVEIIATTEDDDDNDGDESGTLSSISKTEIKVGRNTYKLNSDVSVSVEDGKDRTISKLSDLISVFDREDKGMEVSVTIKNDKVTKIKGNVTKIENQKITYVYAGKDKIQVECDGTPQTYYTNSKTSIKIDGSRNQDMEDLQSYHDDNTIKKINAETIILKDNVITEMVITTSK